MAIQPSEAFTALAGAAVSWPAANEDRLSEAAMYWREAVSRIETATEPAAKAARAVGEHHRGSAIEQFSAFYQRYEHRNQGALVDTREACHRMATLLERYAEQVRETKRFLNSQVAELFPVYRTEMDGLGQLTLATAASLNQLRVRLTERVTALADTTAASLESTGSDVAFQGLADVDTRVVPQSVTTVAGPGQYIQWGSDGLVFDPTGTAVPGRQLPPALLLGPASGFAGSYPVAGHRGVFWHPGHGYVDGKGRALPVDPRTGLQVVDGKPLPQPRATVGAPERAVSHSDGAKRDVHPRSAVPEEHKSGRAHQPGSRDSSSELTGSPPVLDRPPTVDPGGPTGRPPGGGGSPGLPGGPGSPNLPGIPQLPGTPNLPGVPPGTGGGPLHPGPIGAVPGAPGTPGTGPVLGPPVQPGAPGTPPPKPVTNIGASMGGSGPTWVAVPGQGVTPTGPAFALSSGVNRDRSPDRPGRTSTGEASEEERLSPLAPLMVVPVQFLALEGQDSPPARRPRRPVIRRSDLDGSGTHRSRSATAASTDSYQLPSRPAEGADPLHAAVRDLVATVAGIAVPTRGQPAGVCAALQPAGGQIRSGFGHRRTPEQHGPPVHQLVAEALARAAARAAAAGRPTGLGHGYCAEVGLVSEQLRTLAPRWRAENTPGGFLDYARIHLSGARLVVRQVGDSSVYRHGEYRQSCPSCVAVLAEFGVTLDHPISPGREVPDVHG